MSQGKSSPLASRSSRALLFSAGGLLVAGLLGVLVALQLAGSAGPTESSALQSSNHPSGAYRPGQRAQWAERGGGSRTGKTPGDAQSDNNTATDRRADSPSADSTSAAAEDLESLPPELEARLRAAAHVSILPARPGGPVPPSPESAPPALHAARVQAMPDWQRQVQALLDRCVARPAQLRKPTALNVILTPPLTDRGLAQQVLSPAAVTLPPDELRRLWRDTDPDALDSCLQEVRGLALAVAPPPGTSAQVMPVAFEHLLVQL